MPKDLKIYAFGAALGGTRVPAAARALARQSGIPARNLRLAAHPSTYAHNDPNTAYPKNKFVDGLVPFLKGIQRQR